MKRGGLWGEGGDTSELANTPTPRFRADKDIYGITSVSLLYPQLPIQLPNANAKCCHVTFLDISSLPALPEKWSKATVGIPRFGSKCSDGKGSLSSLNNYY